MELLLEAEAGERDSKKPSFFSSAFRTKIGHPSSFFGLVGPNFLKPYLEVTYSASLQR